MKILKDPKELCLALAQCDKEKDIIKLLSEYGLWQNDSLWKNYGDTENNFSVVGNQASKAEAALVEKLINSVDAVLMKECYLSGTNPAEGSAPSSIQKAVSKFFKIPDGKLSNITPLERGKLAENICVVSTGSKTNPCYSIIDRGEGQVSEKFKDTFLSLGKTNKFRIPFVQGKFNQGGTGVLQFCGSNNLQLIISKRHPDIARTEEYVTKNKWGFTIVRRDNPSEGVRSSTYRYLAPEGEVLSFESDFLPLCPSKYPNPYDGELSSGTFIKLYEYQMPGLKTNILFDLYNRLSLLIPSVGLPIRLCERRKGYSGHTFETTLSGLNVRLDEDRRKNLEVGFPATLNLSVMGEQMTARIFAFKRDASEKYMKNEGVVFTVNGQTHGQIAQNFFSRKSVGMGYLANSLLVIIDCTNLRGRAREDLFMTSRDRLRSGELKSEIEKNLEAQLKRHTGLKELREKRRREDIEGKLEDSKPLADIIENILKKSPALSTLFIQGVRLPNPFNVGKGKSKKEFDGERFPTYFTLIEKLSFERPKSTPINRKFRVQYKTDACNDYFDRDSMPGSFFLQMNGERIQDYSLNLWNGIANLNVTLPSGVSVGDILVFESLVNDDSRASSISEKFYVKVLERADKKNGGTGGRKPPSSSKGGKEADKLSYLALPNVVKVRRDDWDRHSFHEQSAMLVKPDGKDGYDFFINMDNIYLLTEEKSISTIDPKLLEARYEYGMVLIGIALLKYSEKKDDTASDDNEEDIFSKISSFSEAVSPILLPMISYLGSLAPDEKIQSSEE